METCMFKKLMILSLGFLGSEVKASSDTQSELHKIDYAAICGDITTGKSIIIRYKKNPSESYEYTCSLTKQGGMWYSKMDSSDTIFQSSYAEYSRKRELAELFLSTKS
jgi:hypothetical protein